jgi:DNA-binding beta-propeller fold protein YncE
LIEPCGLGINNRLKQIIVTDKRTNFIHVYSLQGVPIRTFYNTGVQKPRSVCWNESTALAYIFSCTLRQIHIINMKNGSCVNIVNSVSESHECDDDKTVVPQELDYKQLDYIKEMIFKPSELGYINGMISKPNTNEILMADPNNNRILVMDCQSNKIKLHKSQGLKCPADVAFQIGDKHKQLFICHQSSFSFSFSHEKNIYLEPLRYISVVT